MAILLQKEELELQRDELRQNTEELAGQRDQLELQNQTFKKQAFEATFFHMLSLHHSIVENVKYRGQNRDFVGRACFRIFYDYLRTSFEEANDAKGNTNGGVDINSVYMDFYKVCQSTAGHYFRNLYTLVKFVDDSPVDNKKFYTNIVRAQLSSYELLFLFYNCISDCGREKFKPLVERYALLKNMPGELLDEGHRIEYEKSAFGE